MLMVRATGAGLVVVIVGAAGILNASVSANLLGTLWRWISKPGLVNGMKVSQWAERRMAC